MSPVSPAAHRAALVARCLAEETRQELGALAVAVIVSLPNPNDPAGFHNVTAADTMMGDRDFWLAVHDAARRRLALLGVTTAALEVPS